MSEIKLYEYQEKMVENTIKSLKKHKKSLVVMPTGAGKTFVFCEIIKRLKLKTLIIAHTKELIDQANKSAYLFKIPEDLLQIDSIQKISHHSNEINLNKNYELIIIDECHRACAPSYLKLLNKFPNAFILGVTATPYRTDGKVITSIFGYPDQLLSMIDLIKNGFLCDFKGYRVKTNTSLKNIPKSSTTKDFSSKALSSVINVKSRNEIIFNSWEKLAKNNKTLGFGANVEHCVELARTFTERGIFSKSIHGKLPKGERDVIINDFKIGIIKVLWNCQILTEGFDDPTIKCILMARPTLSKRLYIQMIGRGSRISPGKEFCQVIEFTDNNYDVCDLRDLLQLPKKSTPLLDGELITRYHDKIKNELLDCDGDVVIEGWQIVKPQYDPPASESLLKILEQFSIKHPLNITEFEANILLNNFLTRSVNE